MNVSFRRSGAALIASLSIAGMIALPLPVAAQVPGMPGMPGMPPGVPGVPFVLTEAQVLGFIATAPALFTAMEALEQRYNLPAVAPDNPMAAVAAYMEIAPALAELDAIAAQGGLTNYMTFIQVMSAITSGMMFANPELTAEQRAMLQAFMPPAMIPSPENLAIITAHFAELAAIINEM